MRLILLIGLLGAGLALVGAEKKVVCYFSGWAFYRPGAGKFDIENIDPELCTHINYAFANMDNSTWELVSYDPWYDLSPTDQGCDRDHCHWDSYRRFNNLKNKNPNLKTLISVGGWNSGSGQWSQMAADPMKRQIFIRSSLTFLSRFGFNGIDFDWEYPGSRPGSDPEHDKESFTVFIQEYAEALHQEGYILTAATSPNVDIAGIGYDFPKVMAALDFANIMVYDYHGTWENFTGHETPLYGRIEESNPDHPGYLFNVNATVSYYLAAGAPADKLVLGTAGYGRGFIADSRNETGLYCPTAGPIPAAEFTRSPGFWSYYEILGAMQEESWEMVRDGCYLAPYAVNSLYWIGYEDRESIKLKAQFANTKGLGGIMFFSIDMDDFNGLYGSRYPLLNQVKNVMNTGEELDPENILGENSGCESAPYCDIF